MHESQKGEALNTEPFCSTDVETMIEEIAAREPLITDSKRPHVRKLLHKLVEKQLADEHQQVVSSSI
jgi:hypothetical protein